MAEKVTRLFDVDGKDDAIDAVSIILQVIEALPEEDRLRVLKTVWAFLNYSD